eukprot:3854893-Pyramimonas_sp.AAC.1
MASKPVSQSYNIIHCDTNFGAGFIKLTRGGVKRETGCNHRSMRSLAGAQRGHTSGSASHVVPIPSRITRA